METVPTPRPGARGQGRGWAVPIPVGWGKPAPASACSGPGSRAEMRQVRELLLVMQKRRSGISPQRREAEGKRSRALGKQESDGHMMTTPTGPRKPSACVDGESQGPARSASGPQKVRVLEARLFGAEDAGEAGHRSSG